MVRARISYGSCYLSSMVRLWRLIKYHVAVPNTSKMVEIPNSGAAIVSEKKTDPVDIRQARMKMERFFITF